jgi:hypothetical protein
VLNIAEGCRGRRYSLNWTRHGIQTTLLSGLRARQALRGRALPSAPWMSIGRSCERCVRLEGALQSLRGADAVIAVSQFTADALID